MERISLPLDNGNNLFLNSTEAVLGIVAVSENQCSLLIERGFSLVVNMPAEKVFELIDAYTEAAHEEFFEELGFEPPPKKKKGDVVQLVPKDK